MPTIPTRRARPRRVVVAIVLVVVVVVVVVGVLGAVTAGRVLGVGPFADPQSVNRFAQRAQYADPESAAAQALAAATASGDPAAAAYDVLASTPTAIWVTPEAHPVDEVGDWVGGKVRAAEERDELPVLVVYGIEDRDCGGLSGGGLPAQDYLPWVRALALGAAREGTAVVVLEPDALAAATECDLLEARTTLLASAVEELRAAGLTTYVDAGHSRWVPPARMAELLRAVGVKDVRGFAINVSNYQSTQAEIAYAEELSAALDGAHYVVDTGRNGAVPTDDWCNPPGRALGTRPGFVDDGTAMDATVWVKPPGESDGTCGGGPPAGDFWPARAQQLVAADPSRP